MYLLLLVSLAALLCWFLQGQRSSIRRNGKRLPRPPGTLPVAGNGIWFLQPRHRLLEWFSQVQRRAGLETYEISVPSLPPAIVINDPVNVEHVFKNNDIFVKGDFFKARSWDLFGNGIINADGPLWRTQRKAGLRFFSQSQLQTFIDTLLPAYLSSTFDTLDHHFSTGSPCDLQAMFLELTTRLMGKMAYDMDMPSSLPFSQAFDYASGVIGERFQNPFWRLKELILGKKMRTAVKEVKRFGDEIVSAAIQRREEKHPGGIAKEEEDKAAAGKKQHSHLIDFLLDHFPSQRAVIADAAMNYLSAGRDTTAQSLTWTFYLLLRNPACIAPLRSELHTIFHNNSGGPASPCPSSLAEESNGSITTPTYATLNNTPNCLPYTSAVFNESLRLFPPVPIELKECTSPTTFPDGTSLPAGAIVMWIPWAMNRSHSLWGNDTDDFRPGRWLLEHGNNDNDANTNDRVQENKMPVLTRPAHEFPVFNGGARTCLGRRMAELLGVAVIAAIMGRGYEFTEVDGLGGEKGNGNDRRGGKLEEKKSQNSLTLPMEGGLWVKVRKRNASAGRRSNVQ